VVWHKVGILFSVAAIPHKEIGPGDQEMEGWQTSFCGYMGRTAFRQVSESVEVVFPEFAETSALWCE
jgi:hypothetical protein